MPSPKVYPTSSPASRRAFLLGLSAGLLVALLVYLVMRDQRPPQHGSGRSSGTTDSGHIAESPAAPDTTPSDGHPVRRITQLQAATPPVYELIDREGLLTTQAVSAGSLTPEEVRFTQDQLITLFQGLKAEIEKASAPDLLRSTDGVRALRVSPFEEAGEKFFGTFIQSLTERVGPDRAWLLAKSFPVDRIAGGMGRNEVLLKISPPAPEVAASLGALKLPGSLATVEYEVRDPESGRVLSGSTGPFEELNRDFCGALPEP